MNALVKKEIRLLLPSFGLALALALSIWLIPTGSNQKLFEWLVVPPLLLCPALVVLMALDSFGREFGANTFAQLLAQPVSRARVWRTKTALLALALVVVFVVWWLSFLWHAPGLFSAKAEDMRVMLTTTVLLVLTAFSGGLWSVILLRQVGAAFWFTLIIPAALAMLTISATEKLDQIVHTERNLVFVLGTYSVVGFIWARRLFLTAQDPGWTGGTLTLPTLNQLFSPTQPASGARSHPFIALFRKEIQFQQMSVVLAALLFVAHLVVIGCQNVMTVERDSPWKLLFDGFWVLWFILPLMIGCSAVAEERRLGTLEPQLCLPVSRAKQFYVKLANVMLCALVLGTLPVLLIHFIGMGFGLATSALLADRDAKFVVSVAGSLIALLAFYASTVCRHFLQAIAATIGTGVMFAFLGNWLVQPAQPLDFRFWEGPIGVLMGGAVAGLLAFGLLSGRGRWRLFFGALAILAFLFVVGWLLSGSLPDEMPFLSLASFVMIFGPVALVLVLAYQNFSRVNSDGAMWRKNLGVWFAGLAITSVLATATYHRVWEIGARFEPSAGPARLSGDVRPTLTAFESNQGLLVLLPNGRLVAVRRDLPASGQVEDGGSNWVAIAASLNYGAGIKSDGSLWSLSWWGIEQPNGEVIPAATNNWKDLGRQLRRVPLPITTTRMDNETNWTSIASGHSHFLALKRDGTLWGWGENPKGRLGAGLPEFVSAPVSLGTDSDWVFVSGFSMGSVAVKRDHSVWKWGQAYPITERGIGKGYIGATPQKIATLPTRVTRIISTHYGDIFFCEDGSGWGLGQVGGNYLGAGHPSPMLTTLTELWDNSRWTEASGEVWRYVAGIQADGSLWLQNGQTAANPSTLPPPARLGVRTDWIALQMFSPSVVYALARDGTLCCFGEAYNYRTKLTRPTQRVTWSVNLLESGRR